MKKILALAVIMVACFFDPIRDVWMADGTTGWWPRHLVKWISWYTPLVWIVLREWWPWYYRLIAEGYSGNLRTPLQLTKTVYEADKKWSWQRIYTIIGITVLAWLVWQAGMWVSGAGWTSMWVRWLKG